MRALLTAVREFYGLFVEDGRYTLSILLWVAVLGLIAAYLPNAAHWGALPLFLGLALLLVANVWRSGREATRTKRATPPRHES